MIYFPEFDKMLTKRMILFFGFRQTITNWLKCSGFHWDKRTQLLKLSPLLDYIGLIAFSIYLAAYACATFVRTYIRVWEENVNRQHLAVDCIFFAVLVTIDFMIFLVIGRREEHLAIFNQMKWLDQKLKRKRFYQIVIRISYRF